MEPLIPSRLRWRQLRQDLTLNRRSSDQLAALDDALTAQGWPNAWRVAAPGWLPAAHLYHTEDERFVPMWEEFKLARALDFYSGAAIASTPRVVERLAKLDLAHITHVRYDERMPWGAAPYDPILCALLASGAFNAVTHFAFTPRTLEELEAVVKLPHLMSLQLLGYPPLQDHAQLAQVLAKSATLRHLDAAYEVLVQAAQGPLRAQLTRVSTSRHMFPHSERAVFPINDLPETFVGHVEVPWLSPGDDRSFAHARTIYEDGPEALASRLASAPDQLTSITLTATKKPGAKLVKQWASSDVLARPVALNSLALMHPVTCAPPAHTKLLSAWRPLDLSAALTSAQPPHVLVLGRRDQRQKEQWSAAQLLDTLALLPPGHLRGLSIDAQLQADEALQLLRHPALTELHALHLGFGDYRAPKLSLDEALLEALASLTQLSSLSLSRVTLAPGLTLRPLRALSQLALFHTDCEHLSLEADLEPLYTQRLEEVRVTTWASRSPNPDALLSNFGPLMRTFGVNVQRKEDDNESLEYGLCGSWKSAPSPLPHWLDEPL